MMGKLCIIIHTVGTRYVQYDVTTSTLTPPLTVKVKHCHTHLRTHITWKSRVNTNEFQNTCMYIPVD